MGLSKYKLGELIELRNARNVDSLYGIPDVRGVNNLKQLMPTKADLNGRDLTKFQIVSPDEFVFNHRTSRNGSKFSIAYNDGDTPIICTEDYVVFRIKDDCKKTLNARWLYMLFNRPEFDRYVITNSWGSSTEFYNWEDICSIKLDLPPLDIQQKYVDVYNAMLANQQSYERGLEDLKLTCDAYIDQLRSKYPSQKLGMFISLSEEKNEDLQYGIDDVRGVSIEKKFIDTKANMEGVSLRPYAVIKPDEFAYVTVTSRNGGKISLAHNNTPDSYICSSSYVSFAVTNTNALLPSYLAMLFRRGEFDRYARFHSWGSARETFDWDEMCDVKIPIPSIEIQQDIVNIYDAYLTQRNQRKTQNPNQRPLSHLNQRLHRRSPKVKGGVDVSAAI